MIPLFTNEEYEKKGSMDLLPCKCRECEIIFHVPKKYVAAHYRGSTKFLIDFCSRKCVKKSMGGIEKLICSNCNKIIVMRTSQIKRSKSGNNFCCKSCAATYNNKHKTIGNRRSKLEIWLESELINIYPNLDMVFNGKEAINSELDIYIPSLKLAFELNGIFHYEPIFGEDKLAQIKNNDNRKFQACIENGIELCLIDTSSQKYVKESTCKKYIDIITTIINQKIVPPSGIEPDLID